MKKTKRLLALLLTFAALVSLLAFPIAVAEDAAPLLPVFALDNVPIALMEHCISWRITMQSSLMVTS